MLALGRSVAWQWRRPCPAAASPRWGCGDLSAPGAPALALFRMDGAYGALPYYTDCRERGVPFLTRLNLLNLFDQPEVRQRLRSSDWVQVPSSLSGPRRGALEVGLVTVPPGKETKRKDGSAYAPVTVRVVVSRYPRQEKAEHGVVIEGWQYELFAIDAPVEAFSAADVVATYFGRAGQENRFAQEDREAGLDHLFSAHRPGQEFASLMGLRVWNLRVVHGFELAPPPDQQPLAALPLDASDQREATVPYGEGEVLVEALASPTETPTVQPSGVPPKDEVIETLNELTWESLLAHRPGWAFHPLTAELVCPEGRPLFLTTVDLREKWRGRACSHLLPTVWGL